MLSKRRIYTLHGKYRFINSEWVDAISQSSLGNLDEWQFFDAGEMLVGGSDEKNHVFRVSTCKGPVIFKRYRISTFIFRRYKISTNWRYFMRPGRAAGEWTGLTAMNKVGIPIPEIVSFGEDRRFGRLIGGYIITQELESAMDLAMFAQNVWDEMQPLEKKVVLSEIRSKLFDLVKRAHDNNLFHRDLTWKNILVRKESDGYRLWFIDCPRFKSRRIGSSYLQMVDLSCLTKMALEMLTITERYRSLLIFFDGDRTKTRKIFREITLRHAKSARAKAKFSKIQAEQV